MWLYLFSLLAIGGVQSLTIDNPFRSLLAHNPTRSQFKDKTSATQGFLVYLDNSGIEHIVSYNYAEPVYAIHQINYINRESPNIQTLSPPESSEVSKAQEAHFRGWSLQQYQVLKREIDLLREEGKEPSAETLLKFIPLEKIALTADYSKIAELPEVKRIREEHLNIWQQVPQADEDKIKAITKSNNDNSNISSGAIKETLPKNLANEQHQQVLNDQIVELKKSELQQQYAEDSNTKSNISQSLSEDKSIRNQNNTTKASDEIQIGNPEVNFATKIGTESVVERKPVTETNDTTVLNIDIENPISSEKETIEITSESKENKTSTEESKQKESSEINNDQTLIRVQPLQVLDTPEVIKAREEHLKLVMQANKKVHVQKKIQGDLEKLISTAPKIYVPQQVVDTAEVMRARDEHLRIVSEAIRKVKLAQGQPKDITTEPANVLNVSKVVEKAELIIKSEMESEI